MSGGQQKGEPRELPVRETQPGYCQKCGAYVGAFYRCSVCGAKMPHGTRLRVTQVVVVAAVIIGLFGLSVYARVDPAPTVAIGDIGPTYSNGTVTINGNITNIDYRVASDGSWRMIIFTVTDETGSIDVKAYTETTEEMIEDHNTPAFGDECTVRGSVYIKGSQLYLLIDGSSYFQPHRVPSAKYTATEFRALYDASSSSYLGKRVCVNGTVTLLEDWYLELDQSVRVYIPEYVRDFSPDFTWNITKGDFVNVTGVVTEYRGEPELEPATLYEIVKVTTGGATA
ncbi:MAG: hypothetical protein ACTSU5_16385 [Promethearchaeota archaeon]